MILQFQNILFCFVFVAWSSLYVCLTCLLMDYIKFRHKLAINYRILVFSVFWKLYLIEQKSEEIVLLSFSVIEHEGALCLQSCTHICICVDVCAFSQQCSDLSSFSKPTSSSYSSWRDGASAKAWMLCSLSREFPSVMPQEHLCGICSWDFSMFSKHFSVI